MKEIIAKMSSRKKDRIIGPIVTGSTPENIREVPAKMWKKLNLSQRIRFNNLYAMFWDSVNYHPGMTKDSMFDEYRDTLAYNFALLVTWDEGEMISKICRHSFVKAQGIGGGHIFKYCNKCGMTEPAD